MSRAHLRHIVKDRAGSVVQNAAVHAYQPGTATAPIGTMYDARTGGNVITNPLISNNQGEIEAWLDTPQTLDLKVTDNADTAFYPGASSTLLSWADFTETAEAAPSPEDTAKPVGPLANVDPRGRSGITGLPVASRTAYSRITFGSPKTVDAVGLEIGTSSGNICVAPYDNSGSGRAAVPTTRKQTSGSVACPASGYAEIALGAAVSLSAGEWLSLGADNTTATFARTVGTNGVPLSNGLAYQELAFPAPASVGTLIENMYTPILIGVE